MFDVVVHFRNHYSVPAANFELRSQLIPALEELYELAAGYMMTHDESPIVDFEAEILSTSKHLTEKAYKEKDSPNDPYSLGEIVNIATRLLCLKQCRLADFERIIGEVILSIHNQNRLPKMDLEIPRVAAAQKVLDRAFRFRITNGHIALTMRQLGYFFIQIVDKNEDEQLLNLIVSCSLAKREREGTTLTNFEFIELFCNDQVRKPYIKDSLKTLFSMSAFYQFPKFYEAFKTELAWYVKSANISFLDGTSAVDYLEQCKASFESNK